MYAQKIGVDPVNTAGLTGSIVELFCRWDNQGAGTVQWYHYNDPTAPPTGRMISENSDIKLDKNKYALTGNPSIGEFNLQINNLADSDVGEYSCHTQLVNVRYGMYVLKVGKCIMGNNMDFNNIMYNVSII